MIPQTAPDESTLMQAILLTIAYADIFDYPLTASEIHRYLTGVCATLEQVKHALPKMSAYVHTGGYYSLPERESIIGLRQKRDEKSVWLWRHAVRYGQRIARLPYIRMVAVTGSLAMNNTDSRADIDYLIVTEPGHLWLCRAMVHALRRIAVIEGLNLCPNYLITTQALRFTDQNLYTAHELAQMIPLSGLNVYREIRKQNEWVSQYLPNAEGIPPTLKPVVIRESRHRFRSVLETVLRTPLAARLEQWEMNRKILMLSREQSNSSESCFTADCCKGHANLHGALTNKAFNERLRSLPGESPS